MLELIVNSNDVLRYRIIGDWDKVQELRNRGYYVQVKLLPRSRPGSDVGNRSVHSTSTRNNYDLHHDDEFDVHNLAEARPDDESYVIGFY
jgi:hypothetical protein